MTSEVNSNPPGGVIDFRYFGIRGQMFASAFGTGAFLVIVLGAPPAAGVMAGTAVGYFCGAVYGRVLDLFYAKQQTGRRKDLSTMGVVALSVTGSAVIAAVVAAAILSKGTQVGMCGKV
jgi:hypothetical protein